MPPPICPAVSGGCTGCTDKGMKGVCDTVLYPTTCTFKSFCTGTTAKKVVCNCSLSTC